MSVPAKDWPREAHGCAGMGRFDEISCKERGVALALAQLVSRINPNHRVMVIEKDDEGRWPVGFSCGFRHIEALFVDGRRTL